MPSDNVMEALKIQVDEFLSEIEFCSRCRTIRIYRSRQCVQCGHNVFLTQKMEKRNEQE